MEYIHCTAILSDDKVYRYVLSRIWDERKRPVLWVMLNPSTADGSKDDPTIRKIVKFSVKFGYGGLYVVNLYAFRTKSPTLLFKDEKIDYIGPENNRYIESMGLLSNIDVIFACGRYAWKSRLREIYKILSGNDCYYLKKNTDGTPSHPLYLLDNTPLKRFVLKSDW